MLGGAFVTSSAAATPLLHTPGFLGRKCLSARRSSTHLSLVRPTILNMVVDAPPVTDAGDASTAVDAPPALLGLPSPPRVSGLGHSMRFRPISGLRRVLRPLRMLRQVRGRLRRGTVMTARIGGSCPEVEPRGGLLSLGGGGGPGFPALSTVTEALRIGAHDPRLSHLYLRIDALSCGWAKVIEMRRHLEYWREAGKDITVFMESGGPKEFFLAMGYETYVAPEGDLSLRGFTLSGAFLGGVLEKIGVEPQVERFGKYKSAGDQLSRRDMSDAQREVLKSLLDEINETWSSGVAEATGKTRDEVDAFVDRAPWDIAEYVEAGFIAGVKSESDIEDAFKLKYCRRNERESVEDILKRKLPTVDMRKYLRRTSENLVAISGRKRIAVIRAVGAITSGRSGNSPLMGATLGSESLVELIRRVRDDKRYVACILRCDSPGGSALASDIMWSELRKLAAKKPLIASQSDVAASGGYYLSMACDIVAENLTITGSVGVVTVKPSLGKLYEKIGFEKENISIGGKYAELLVDYRPFTESEAEYYRDGAFRAYKSFVTKAAKSRGKTYDEMHEVAQGRVWTGRQARECGMVDHIGGIRYAVELLKEKAGIGADEYVRLEEIREPVSIAARLGLGAASAASGLNAAALRGPLLMSEVDAQVSGVSPLAQFVSAATVAPLVNLLDSLPATARVLRAVLSDMAK